MIDFSCKHDILIRNEDGHLLPMDEPFFQPKKIAPGTWQILSDGDYSYLVEGDNEALVIDSGYGCGNVREFCQTLTTKPVRRIVNTHHHFDHTANNCYFECAYMAKESVEYATIPFPSFEGIDFPKDYPINIIDEGYVFDLGNRSLEVFNIPDHAPGSIALLDTRERLLFTGDEIMPHGKRLNGSVERFARNMAKLGKCRNDYDRLCAGAWVLDATYIDKYLANAQHILDGNMGVLLAPKSASSMQTETDEMGRTIYNRRAPRPCDLPKHFGEIPAHIRKNTYADCDIIYDERKVND